MKPKFVILLVVACWSAVVAPEMLSAAGRKAQPEAPPPVAKMVVSGSDVWFDPVVSFGALDLSFALPDGTVREARFVPGETPNISITPDMPDGIYRYELRVTPVGTLRTRPEEDPATEQASATPLVQNGSFHVVGGKVLRNDAAGPVEVQYDIVHSDDVIITGSLGVGLDSVVNQNFGFDTIRLSEDNTRIKFDDASTIAGYPANDWQLTANDSNAGGSNYFSIDDVTGAKTPFKVTAGAPTNSFFMGSTGRIGLKTATPVLDLHLNTGNTPGFRLEQNSSSGFVAQTWDIAANETSFFVRDVTGGSRLPLRIRPGAPSSSIDISGSGNVGFGTASPARQLHVVGQNAVFRMDRTADTAAFLLVRTDPTGATPWKTFVIGTNATGVNQGEFIINDIGDAVGGAGARRMTISNNGSVTFTGQVYAAGFTPTSSLAFKTNIRTFENALETVNRLRGVRFDWKDSGKPAVGLIAEEVDEVVPEVVAHEGGTAKGVNYANLVAVLVEAIKAQEKTIQEQQEGLCSLKAELDEIKALLNQSKR